MIVTLWSFHVRSTQFGGKIFLMVSDSNASFEVCYLSLSQVTYIKCYWPMSIYCRENFTWTCHTHIVISLKLFKIT